MAADLRRSTPSWAARTEAIRRAGSLLVDGPDLYGVTSQGGQFNKGTIYKIGSDGSDFDLLHEFGAEPTDGGNPLGGLTLVGSILFGMNYGDNEVDRGKVFQLNTDGSDFLVLSVLGGRTTAHCRPARPPAGLDALCAADFGGDNDFGVIFALTIPEPSSFALALVSLVIAMTCAAGRCRKSAAECCC